MLDFLPEPGFSARRLLATPEFRQYGHGARGANQRISTKLIMNNHRSVKDNRKGIWISGFPFAHRGGYPGYQDLS